MGFTSIKQGMGVRENQLVSTSLIFWILHIIPIYLLDDVFCSLFTNNSNTTSTEGLELDSYLVNAMWRLT